MRDINYLIVAEANLTFTTKAHRLANEFSSRIGPLLNEKGRISDNAAYDVVAGFLHSWTFIEKQRLLWIKSYLDYPSNTKTQQYYSAFIARRLLEWTILLTIMTNI